MSSSVVAGLSGVHAIVSNNININCRAIVINVDIAQGGLFNFPVTDYSAAFARFVSKLMWNLNGAGAIDIHNVAMFGTVAAPDAAATTFSG
jgi:choice-of-anchor A domain-containing protein